MKANLKLDSDMTVIRIVPAFEEYGGGSRIHVRELSTRINPYLKRQILIAPFDPETPKSFDDRFDFEIIRVKRPCIKYNIPIISGFINKIIFCFKVFQVLKHLPDIDLIQAHEIYPIAYSSIFGKILKIPVIGMAHGTAEAYSRWSGLRETILATLFKPTYAIVLDSGTRAPEKFRKIWGERVTVVYHGIDTEVFGPKEKDKAILQHLGFKEADLIILSISSLIPIKNIDLAIEAFEKVIAETLEPRMFLLIAGDGNQKEELVKLVDEKRLANRVKFLGSIKNDQVPDYISIADICIGMSLKDNMNRSVLEPMACAKPIIAFDGGSIDEFITTGYNGLLAKRGDVLDFAEKMKFLIENPELRREIGLHARELIVTKRSWNIRIRQDLEVYRKAIEFDKMEQSSI
jgi:glycosyltransferase involved in cell wall biosynthesis